jgi:hypothetical protein
MNYSILCTCGYTAADKYIAYYGNISEATMDQCIFMCLLTAIRRIVHEITVSYLIGTLRLGNYCMSHPI